MSVNRRKFLLSTAAAAANAGVAATLAGSAAAQETVKPKKQPNVVIYHADQFRWDFVGANGLNQSVRTPNLDAIAEHGTNCTHAVTNQPVCAPSRSVLLTGRYATETGVWRNGLGLRDDLPTLATEFRKAGYTANYIGKWHLQANSAAESNGRGFVKPEHRGGFNGLFDGSNALEATAHPYYGTIWDREGNEVTYKDQYRVDFITDRVEKFLVRKILQEEHLAEDTIFVFMSDHGCHFMTRNQEYKRSTHNSSLRVPLLMDGPGFDHGRQISELVGMVDIAPTLLQAAGIPIPAGVQGHSFLPLLTSAEARQSWPNQQFIQISESMTGRAIRTRHWTYCVADLTGITNVASSANYHEYQMYDQGADPYELVNLAGRKEYKEIAETLRGQLKKLMIAANETDPEIVTAKLYP